MRGDELRNWLAVLGIGGGLAVAGPETAPGEPGQAPPGATGDRPRVERAQGPVYVVINHEEQYSIWPARQALPRGWKLTHGAIDLAGAVKRFPRIGDQRFKVVINHEEQYSIWPLELRLPKGFREVAELSEREPCRIDECGRLLAEIQEAGGGS